MVCSNKVVFGAAFFWLVGWVCSGSAIGEVPEAPNDQADPAKSVQVTPYDTVSLNVQNTDLTQVLQLLSVHGQRNIVPSPQVSGSVTANLYDVTFDEALNAILKQNGCGYREEGNFIFVYTQEELRKIQEAERALAYRIFRLNYLTATDASAFVQPLMSSAGTIAANGEVGAGFQPDIGDGGANSYSHDEMLIIRDYPEVLDEIQKVLKQLDIKPSQVLIEATILQADLTEDLAFGVDMAILSDFGIGFPGLSNPLNAVDKMIDGTVQKTTSGAATSGVADVAGQSGGLKVGILTNNVQVFLRALDSVTDTTILANPKIMALNRQRAEILVGEKVAYLSTTATSTSQTQTVEFLDTGTKLTVRPFVSRDGMIRLELRPSISDFDLRTSGGTDLPDETTQELVTNVMVPDGQTVVLGGLFKENTTINRNQVPGLGEVPVVGEAFKGRDNSIRRSEVIFLITPHVVKDKSLADAGEAMMQGVEMVRLGTREGLLPWSRAKLTAGHLRDALKHLRKGNEDKALWEVDLALSIDPRMVEARRLKEKLTGKRAFWPGRSLLNESVDMLVEQQTGEHRDRSSVPIVPDPDPTKPGTKLENMSDAVTPAEPGEAETTSTATTATPVETEAVEPVTEVAESTTPLADEVVEVAATDMPATPTGEEEAADSEPSQPTEPVAAGPESAESDGVAVESAPEPATAEAVAEPVEEAVADAAVEDAVVEDSQAAEAPATPEVDGIVEAAPVIQPRAAIEAEATEPQAEVVTPSAGADGDAGAMSQLMKDAVDDYFGKLIRKPEELADAEEAAPSDSATSKQTEETDDAEQTAGADADAVLRDFGLSK